MLDRNRAKACIRQRLHQEERVDKLHSMLGKAGDVYVLLPVDGLLQRRNKGFWTDLQADGTDVHSAVSEFRGVDASVGERLSGAAEGVRRTRRKQLPQHTIRHPVTPVKVTHAGLGQRRKTLVNLVVQGLKHRVTGEKAVKMLLGCLRQRRDQADARDYYPGDAHARTPFSRTKPPLTY